MAIATDYFNLKNPLRSFASRIALNARRKIYDRFIILAGIVPGRRILDLGTTPDTSLPDSNFLELWYPYRADITMASVEDCSLLEETFPETKFVKIYPDRPLPFPNLHFDIGFSSAVLEHVGGPTQQLDFLTELLRTCKRIFLTTPDRHFPIEVHTFLPILHWLPKNIHRHLLSLVGKHFWASESNLNLLTQRDLSRLATEALCATGRSDQWSIYRHRTFGFFSNLILWISGEPAS
jgi:SAM-dependent methyltransferase